MSAKKHMEFGAKIGKMLNLMIHSVYTNKDIFLRELISNAADAIEKRRFLSISDQSLSLSDNEEYCVSIELNKEKKTITIKDNGIGMNEDDMINNLGIIAKSGTEDFVASLTSSKDDTMIGQFGVGFYSAFMVSSKVEVDSRKAGSDETFKWTSRGDDDGYLVEKTNKHHEVGTSIILHIKNECDEYLDQHKIQFLVETYSSNIGVKIMLIEDDEKKEIANSVALWHRDKKSITEEEYKNFYKSLSHLPDKPAITMHYNVEGNVAFKALMFVPSMKPFDLFHPDRMTRIKLYVKKVFINEDKLDIIPKYLRFIYGIVDCNELPLNISREILQNSAMLNKISDILIKKIFTELKHCAKECNETKEESEENHVHGEHCSHPETNSYSQIWNNFGAVMKEGLCENTQYKDDILELCRFYTVKSPNKAISLEQYFANIKEDQKFIYYAIGDNVEDMISTPQMEQFIKNDIDVLLLTDHVDGFWTTVVTKYKDIEMRSISRADTDIDKTKKDNEKNSESDESKINENKLIEAFSRVLKGKTKEVRISHKLVDSPSCLAIGAGSMDIKLERLLVEQNQIQNSTLKILEINPNNQLIQKCFNLLQEENESLNQDGTDMAMVIFEMACVAQGEALKNPASFVKRINKLLQHNITI